MLLSLDRPLPLLEGITTLSNLRNWEASVGRTRPQPVLAISEKLTPSLADRCSKVSALVPVVGPLSLGYILTRMLDAKRGTFERKSGEAGPDRKDEEAQATAGSALERALPDIRATTRTASFAGGEEERRRRATANDATEHYIQTAMQGLQVP